MILAPNTLRFHHIIYGSFLFKSFHYNKFELKLLIIAPKISITQFWDKKSIYNQLCFLKLNVHEKGEKSDLVLGKKRPIKNEKKSKKRVSFYLWIIQQKSLQSWAKNQLLMLKLPSKRSSVIFVKSLNRFGF